MSPATLDVVIVGAGVSGLAAAARLASAGQQVCIVEARERIGGRIETEHAESWPVPVEHGAEFIHGEPPEILDLAARRGWDWYQIAERHWGFFDGRLDQSPDLWDGVDEILGGLDRVGDEDLSFADYLERYCGNAPDREKSLATDYVEGFNGADRTIIGCRGLRDSEAALEEIGGEANFRLNAGYDQLPRELWRQAEQAGAVLHVSTIVESIVWESGEVRVETRSAVDGATRSFAASQVVVSVPLGVLQVEPPERGAIRFVPDLPEKREAAAGMRMGSVVKVLLRFREVFWGSGDFRGLGFLHAPGKPLPTWWTHRPLEVPVLTGWAGGPAADRLMTLSDEELVNVAVGTLWEIFGRPADELRGLLEDSRVCNWQRDPFSRGAYSYAAVGGGDAAELLREPVAGTLFFAGEALDRLCGTVQGAIASGARAADEILGRRS